ncbi:Myc-type, basic helix-loop-helix (bHLH) domain containing protein [Parasponia andersonii]|uniref:Myc-type, basic helix-loop-helix (BHLH) domain containing protein n=1 Tax=Parasponia andersonii TaxID=3476 RepID=A0A2P5ALZ2_PARAD|nr:Myc-type, basic helix-loop-helix (bHLH) domain containing protein [Parasponia andersonii]
MSKRMRVYSLETNKLLHLVFARNYVSHLVPALKKVRMINTEGSTSSSTINDEKRKNEVAKVVRFEVDMAMALSAKEYNFAWSHALETKLNLRHITVNVVNGGNNFTQNFFFNQISFANHKKMETTAIVEEKAGESSALLLDNPTSSNLRSYDPKLTMINKAARRSRRRARGRAKKSEDDNVNDRLAQLRTLLPGGNEIHGDYENHELLTEVTSYISCLKLQVKVLQCLVELGDE